MFLRRLPAMFITLTNLLKTLFLLGSRGFCESASNGIFAACEKLKPVSPNLRGRKVSFTRIYII
jgi:hypothetical protein